MRTVSDDTLRAEIEAVAEELRRYGVGGTASSMAADAIRVLDRVRDARGDDEAQESDSWQCACGLRWNTRDVGCETCGQEPPAARSPQGENHEAGIEAAWQARPWLGAAGLRFGHVRRMIDAYLARVSPSRDGTVAVEDVEAGVVWALRRAVSALGAAAIAFRKLDEGTGYPPHIAAGDAKRAEDHAREALCRYDREREGGRDGTVAVEDVRATVVAEIAEALRGEGPHGLFGCDKVTALVAAKFIEAEFSPASIGDRGDS